MAFEIADFQEDVIEKSHETPVVVDFWAPWCGPCRVLGPVLEKLAGDASGEWTLAKVNTDQDPELSVRYGIRGIPAVKLFIEGKVVDEFTGALPEYAVKQWLDKALPSESKQHVAQAESALLAGDDELAKALLRQALDADPDNAKARILMAGLVVFHDPEQALDLVGSASFAGPGYVQTEEAVRTLATLLQRGADALPDEPGRDTYTAALDALRQRDLDAALDHFITVIQTHRYYDDDGSRKACVALFNLLGEDHPTTQKHRRTFNMSLY